jgi:hypothetical protein
MSDMAYGPLGFSLSCPASCRASTSSLRCMQGVDGRDKPGHDDDGVVVGQFGYYAVAGNADFAFSTIAWNAAGSLMARSDKTLRSTVRPDLFSPSINRL